MNLKWVDQNLDKVQHEEAFKRMFADARYDVVIDVGAHVGTWSKFWAPRADQVIAMEPHPEAYDILCENTGHYGNITPLRLAAWSKTGKKKLTMYRLACHSTCMNKHPIGKEVLGFGGRPKRKTVSCSTLDDLAKEVNLRAKRLLIKVDVEGGEVDVVKGATTLYRADWFIETHGPEQRDWLSKRMVPPLAFSHGASGYLFGRMYGHI